MSERRRTLGVFKFASCDGCQLTLLDCEDELLAIAERLDIRYFPEASSAMGSGPYDLALVEGSITTPEQAARIREVRAQSRFLVTIGACATAGGVQALRNYRDVKEMMSLVYARPEWIDVLATSTSIAEHVRVDFELQGCPIDKTQLVEVISAFLAGRPPNVPSYSVCMECKMNGTVCVMVARGTPCLGPVTHAGCGALCPSYHRGCYGCFGPMEVPKTGPLAKHFLARGVPAGEVRRQFLTFNAHAPDFEAEGRRDE